MSPHPFYQKSKVVQWGVAVLLLAVFGIVLGVFFTFATLVAYILLGLFMAETSDRTKSLFEGLGIYFKELVNKLGEVFDSIFTSDSTRRNS